MLDPCKKAVLQTDESFSNRSSLDLSIGKSSYHMKGVSAFPDDCAQRPHFSTFLLDRWGFRAYIRSVQSSPGYLHVGHVASNCTRQIPHKSSSGMSQRQDATAFHSLMVTFMFSCDDEDCVEGGGEYSAQATEYVPLERIEIVLFSLFSIHHT